MLMQYWPWIVIVLGIFALVIFSYRDRKNTKVTKTQAPDDFWPAPSVSPASSGHPNDFRLDITIHTYDVIPAHSAQFPPRNDLNYDPVDILGSAAPPARAAPPAPAASPAPPAPPSPQRHAKDKAFDDVFSMPPTAWHPPQSTSPPSLPPQPPSLARSQCEEEHVRHAMESEEARHKVLPKKTFDAHIFMRIAISFIVIFAAIFVVLSQMYGEAEQKWAIGAIGTVVGYWLKA